jgi:hypothetical protein
MGGAAGVSFDAKTVELMRAVLEETAAKVPKHLRTPSVKVELAELILKFAAGGERDPSRLGIAAIRRFQDSIGAKSTVT